MSIFLQFDSQLNQSQSFWTPIDSSSVPDIQENSLYQSAVNLKTRSDLWKTRTLILTPSSLYYSRSCPENPKKKSIVKWKTIEAFEEESISDSSEKRFVLKIGLEEFYLSSSELLENWLNVLSKVSIMTDFDGDYALIKEIGSGNYATVHQAKDLSSLSECAVKIINKEKISQSSRGLTCVISEIEIMRKVDNPNIVKLHKVYENEESIFLVLEFIPGGNLFEKIFQIGKFPESSALKFMNNLLRVLEYLEQLKVVHRDLKPENILMTGQKYEDIKIADFGLACYETQVEMLRCGSPGYIAPEILNKQEYNTKADIFSAGIILYILISGRSPFYGRSPNEILEKNQNGRIYFNRDDWKGISQDCIDLILKLTETNPDLRPSAGQALDHKWFRICEKKTASFSELNLEKESCDSRQLFSSTLMLRMKQNREKEAVLVREEGKLNVNCLQKANRVFKKLRDEDIFNL